MSPSRVLRIDFETRGTVELSTKHKAGRGVYIYARHPATDVWCLAYAFGNDPVQLWRPGEPCPPDIAAHIRAGGLLKAWNAQFERLIFREIMGPRYGWPVPDLRQYRCSMANAYAMSLPGALDGAAAALGLETRKDAVGYRLMLQMAKPRRIEPDGRIVWWDEPDKRERLYAYCKRDVETERAVDERLMQLSPAELEIYFLDQQINDRGMFVDLRLCHAARAIYKKAVDALDAQMRTITAGAVGRCSNAGELTAWLRSRGADVDSVAKDAVVDLLLRDDLPTDVRRALEVRQEAAKSSTAKIEKLLYMTDDDGRVRGTKQYHAAHTGRWGGRGFQPDNLPRPQLVKSALEKDEDEVAIQRIAIDAIFSGDPALVEMLFGPVPTVVADCIRGLVAAPKSRTLTAADFSAIEARAIAWLAGQRDVLDVFASGADIYRQQAAGIFGTTPEAVGKGAKRQVGKVSVLALGFQGGASALLKMGRSLNIRVGDHFDEIWSAARAEHREKAVEAWVDRGKKSGVAENTWKAAEVVKVAWRAANPRIAAYWPSLEDAAVKAVQSPGRTFAAAPGLMQDGRWTTWPVPPVRFRQAGSFLWCQLPSSRVLCFPYPRVVETATPWGAKKPQLLYRSVEQTGKRAWVEGPTYGGALAENVTQAVARDLMADAMLRVTAAGYALVLTVHDELVSEDPAAFGSAEEFKRLMEVVPTWARGFPIAASVWRGARYRK